jgi:hypothetical protein
MIIVGGTPPSPVVSVIGDTLRSSYGTAYQWYFNGAPISGATDSFYVATMPGNYAVQITDSFGCTRLSSGVLAAVSSALGGPGVRLYPNPAGSQFTVYGLQFTVPATIQVYNVLGEKVLQSEIRNQKSEINVSGLAKGIYIVEVRDGEKAYRIRFVKE